MASIQVQAQNKAIVTLRNDSEGILHLDRSKSWQGKPYGGSFPTTIPAKGALEFTHEKGNEPGSMVAVQYSGINWSGKNLAVIVAWDAPGEYDPPNVPNKVYAFGGWKSQMNNLSWEEIQEKLKKQGESSFNIYVDAYINHNSPNSATVDATINLDWP